MSEANTSTVKVGDVEYTFKRVNLATWKKHADFMRSSARAARGGAEAAAADPEAMVGTLLEMGEIVYECIVRANPGVTLETILEGLDQENIGPVYTKVMTGSGYVPVGEPPAGAAA